MKKMFTLLLLSAIVWSTQAQQTEERNIPFDNDEVTAERPGGHFGNNRNAYVLLERERDREIAKINRDYDRQIQKVQQHFFWSRLQKQRMIRQLEDDRRFEIRQVQALYKRKLDRLRRYGNNPNF